MGFRQPWQAGAVLPVVATERVFRLGLALHFTYRECILPHVSKEATHRVYSHFRAFVAAFKFACVDIPMCLRLFMVAAVLALKDTYAGSIRCSSR